MRFVVPGVKHVLLICRAKYLHYSKAVQSSKYLNCECRCSERHLWVPRKLHQTLPARCSVPRHALCALLSKSRRREGTRQTMYSLHWGAFTKPLLLWKSNKYYVLACVCMHARACVRACVWSTERVGVCMSIRAYSLANPARKEHAPYFGVICGPSVSTQFLDIIS